MDNVGFRTLGGGAAGDAKLGPRPHERHSDHGLTGGDGAWGVIWRSVGAITGASYTLFGAAVLFLTSLLLARRRIDQLYRKSRREGFRRFIYSSRTKRADRR